MNRSTTPAPNTTTSYAANDRHLPELIKQLVSEHGDRIIIVFIDQSVNQSGKGNVQEVDYNGIAQTANSNCPSINVAGDNNECTNS